MPRTRRPRRALEFVVAREKFAATYGDEGVVIHAGELLHPDHELVKRYPDRFSRGDSHGTTARRRAQERPVTPEPPAVQHPASASKSPAWRLRDPVDYRPRTTSPITLKLAGSARRALVDHARRSEDGRETGGTLIGAIIWAARPVEILVVTGPGVLARRTPGSYSADDFHAHQVARDLARSFDRTDIDVTGCWHTHPGGSRTPSDADLDAWAQRRQDLNVEFYTAVIVTPDPARGWDRVHLDAWALRKHHSRVVCEPIKENA